MKKIISSLVLSFLFFSTTSALIAIPEDYETKTESEAANFLAEKGIIVAHYDDSELYELGKTIERKAVMKIVMKLSGKTISDTCRGAFSDVQSGWHCKYIEAALDAGYIAENDIFRADDQITYTEAMKLVLKAKGIEKTQETENWQEDYMMTAYEYGIITSKYSNYNENATRGWLFQIATATIEKEEEIKIKIEEKEKLMSDEAM